MIYNKSARVWEALAEILEGTIIIFVGQHFIMFPNYIYNLKPPSHFTRSIVNPARWRNWCQ